MNNPTDDGAKEAILRLLRSRVGEVVSRGK